MTDTEKTLQALKEAGTAGIHSFDLNKIVGTTRSAARVRDLKNQGYSISAVKEKKGDAVGARYYLVSEPETPIIRNYQWKFEGNKAIRVAV